MPLCPLQLLALNTCLADFLSALRDSNVRPLITSRVVRWIITPSDLSASALLTGGAPAKAKWDVMLLLPPRTATLPHELKRMVKEQWTATAGIPSSIIQGFEGRNRRLLSPEPGDTPALTGALGGSQTTDSAQDLELSGELKEWMQTFCRTDCGRGAVSMLNLLSFNEGMKPEYLKYGARFAKGIGSRRGGNAKVVGHVVGIEEGGRDIGKGNWDEIAIAHYPSIHHFADMLASEDYQEVNHAHRVPALRDTFILCTSEIEPDDIGYEKAKL